MYVYIYIVPGEARRVELFSVLLKLLVYEALKLPVPGEARSVELFSVPLRRK